jgi:septal ring factor EnvC (AmiA/AmiB activator)
MKSAPSFSAKVLSSLVFCAVLSQASLPPLAGLPSDLPGSEPAELSRLIEISTRLSEINETLRNELEDSRKTSTELYTTLETSKRELERSKAELERLRMNSTRLLETAQNSEQVLSGLREALRKAENSLMNLELSWEGYRITAENRIAALERRARVYPWALAAAALLAAAGWTAFALRPSSFLAGSY